MRRELAVCLAVGLLGGGLMLLGSGRAWDGAASAAPVPTVSGDAVDPVGSLASTLGAVVLLGTIVVAVTRALGRRLAGSVVVLAALGAAYVATTATGGWSPWRGAVLLGAVLGTCGGALAALRGQRWASMSRRYDAPSTPRPAHESDPWRALDRGEDPTL
ncbi:MAG TPA: Trp biosynthesis-associated membrane protein [Nocardioidaceae bacterium]|nr:Trp biosynthesis-associated membrane protein [Nocardioidaceae bacterium]